MLNEKEIITLISRELPSGPGRISGVGTHDAEVCAFNGDRLLFSTDEFSAEDRFPADDPFTLGWNIAAGAISDIVATGGIPRYFSHALTVDDRWNTTFCTRFSRGIRKVLEHYGTTFIGGDIGRSNAWRCTTSVIGIPSDRIVGRAGAAAGDHLFVTGSIGGGNFNAAIDLYSDRLPGPVPRLGTIRFHLHAAGIPIVSQWATACIDTSDGLCNALLTIADMNRTGFYIDRIPLLQRGVALAKVLRVPEALLYFGECGEYELLFAVPERRVKDLLAEARRVHYPVRRIGRVTAAHEGRMLPVGGRMIDADTFTLRARDFSDTATYLGAMRQWITTVEKG